MNLLDLILKEYPDWRDGASSCTQHVDGSIKWSMPKGFTYESRTHAKADDCQTKSLSYNEWVEERAARNRETAGNRPAT